MPWRRIPASQRRSTRWTMREEKRIEREARELKRMEEAAQNVPPTCRY